MPLMAKIALLFVVFVDLIGQGLVFPIINELIMAPDSPLLPAGTPDAARHLDYGLVIGSFFLAWFLGVVYVARLSDSIGRKQALMICLGGALLGYVLTIAALYVGSLWLLILGRAVSGFTAGNQPIAQAAMVDASTDAADRDRNMGYIVTGISFGLVGGPIIGGIFSDQGLLGSIASVEAPFYASLVLVIVAMLLVLVFFEDARVERRPFVFRPQEIVENLWQVTRHPLVLRLLPVYVVFMVANLTFYIFIDNFLTSAFDYGIVGGSAVMLVIGFALAFSSTFLVQPTQARFDKHLIIALTFGLWAGAALAVAASPLALLCFVPVFLFYFCFGVAYPTMIGIFSGSVGEADQGWIMGITTAVFTLVGGIMSLIGGWLMSVDIRLPFYISATAAALGLLLVAASWSRPEIRRLTGRATGD
ncbi:MAG: MFS transporter [Geminicoccaceae bacterium]